MNDIEVLENIINRCEKCKLPECINCEISWNEVQALENLIKGYREKEEKLIDERILTQYMQNNIKGYQEELENSIPKLKIKEKIEELKDMIIEKHRGNLQRYTVSEILSFIRFCEELLKGE